MIREDFLLRMIQRLAEVIGRALGLARNGKVDEAERALDEATTGFAGMRRSMLDRLAPDEVVHALGPEKSMAIAAILDAEAEIRNDPSRAARANAIRAAAGLPLR